MVEYAGEGDKEMATLKLGVLGSGSGSNMQSIVDAIEKGELDAEVKLVLADVPDAKILDRAKRHGIPCRYLDCAPWKTKLEGPAEDECIRLLKEAGCYTVILAGFMRIVKPALLAVFPMRVLNIHPALLPAFPWSFRHHSRRSALFPVCTPHHADALPCHSLRRWQWQYRSGANSRTQQTPPATTRPSKTLHYGETVAFAYSIVISIVQRFP